MSRRSLPARAAQSVMPAFTQRALERPGTQIDRAVAGSEPFLIGGQKAATESS